MSSSEEKHPMRDALTERGADGWQFLWEQKTTPWNMGEPAPPLVEFISSQHSALFPPTSGLSYNCLVPGCGQGLDVMYFASLPSISLAVGLDLAPLAIEQANQLLLKHAQPHSARIEFHVQDFFAYEPSDLFDFVFDYTFFCAIPPSLRVSWACQMKKLIKPGGHLLTLMFPLGESRDIGPPFGVSLEEYQSLLCDEPGGFERMGEPWVSSKSHPNRQGREKGALWRRQ